MNTNLKNEKNGLVDLSPLLSAVGQRLILRPKGDAGDTHEITPETLAAPTVQAFLAHGWVSAETISLTPETAAEAPSADKVPAPPAGDLTTETTVPSDVAPTVDPVVEVPVVNEDPIVETPSEAASDESKKSKRTR